MLRRTAHLPDPVIGLKAYALEMPDVRRLQMPGLLALRHASLPRLMKRVHHLAEDVDLELAVRGVADAHGA